MEGVGVVEIGSFLLSGPLYISVRRGWVSLPVLVTPHDTLIMLHVGFELSIDLPSDQSIILVRYEEQNRTFWRTGIGETRNS